MNKDSYPNICITVPGSNFVGSSIKINDIEVGHFTTAVSFEMGAGADLATVKLTLIGNIVIDGDMEVIANILRPEIIANEPD